MVCLENNSKIINHSQVQASSCQIVFKDKQIAYQKVGKGELIVFIHGLGLSKNVWQTSIDRLQEQFECLAVDLPGSGASEFVPEIKMQDYAVLIQQILTQEHRSTATLIGHSFGGYISLAFAKMFPQNVQSLVLFHSTAMLDSELKLKNRQQVIRLAEEKQQTDFFFPNLINNQFTVENQERLQAIKEVFLKESERIDYKTLIQYQQAMIERESGEDFLQNTTVPILFLHGKSDPFITEKDIITQALWCKQASICVLEQSAHLGMIEEAEKSSNRIKNFLQLK